MDEVDSDELPNDSEAWDEARIATNSTSNAQATFGKHPL